MHLEILYIHTHFGNKITYFLLLLYVSFKIREHERAKTVKFNHRTFFNIIL